MNRKVLYIFNSCIAALFFVVFSTIVQVAPAKAQQKEIHVEIERIQQRGFLTIAMHSEDTKPFYMVDKGELVGFDVDIARDIAKRLGVEPKFNRGASTFNEVVDLIVRKEADIAISMLSNTLGRAMKVRFSEPYITLYRTLIVNRLKFAKRRSGKNKKIKNVLQLILQLQDINIGVVAGSSYVGFAEEDFPNATVIPYKDWDAVMQGLLKGEVFAGLYDNNDTANWSFEHPESALYLKTILLKDKKDTLSFAVHNENEYLFHWLNLYINKMKSDGTYEVLSNKYFSDRKIDLQ